MNIAFVNATKKWGGVKTHTINFGKKLVESGHQVFLYAGDDTFTAKAAAAGFHTRKVNFGSDYSLFSIAFFLQEFKRRKVNVLIANVGKDMTTAGIAARLLGIPVVQRIGAHSDMLPKTKYKVLHAFLQPIFFCPSEYIAEHFLKTIPWIQPDQVKVIRNGRTPADDEPKTHFPRRLIATQRLDADKGHDTLLKAAAKLSQPFALHIVGTGGREAELHRLADDLGLRDKVVWHGFTGDVETLLEESDIFLLASLMEGLPNTLLEALSVGLLPVCRDVAGTYEVWPDALSEYLLPYAADENTFAEAIGKALVLSDEELLSAKYQARKACEEKCNLNTLSAQFEAWLLDLAGKR